ncbi:MAG: LAGLIDADG family homing endonuclease, partial [Halanaerobiales bacterium]
DKILIQSGEGSFSKEEKLPFKVKRVYRGKNGRKYDYNFPARWSKELGQVLGWFVGDGWIRKGDRNRRAGLTFSENDKEALNYFKPIINEMYGNDIKEIERKNGTYHLSYHSKYFVDYLFQLGLKDVSADNKEVPKSIFTAPRRAVIGFLQGLFTADGTVSCDEKNGNYYIQLSSKSRKLLQQVQLLLLNLGIKSRLYNRNRKPRFRTFQYTDRNTKKVYYNTDGILYELNITRENIKVFASKIGFILRKKNNIVDKIVSEKNLRSSKNWTAVDNKQYITPEVVYDITEPNTHSFVANGLISHNCGEQPLLPYEACNLGSLNLSHMIKDNKQEIDYDKLKKTIRIAVRFLDNVIDMNEYPLKEIEEMVKNNRKIGLGVMGWSDLLIRLGIPYNSEKAVEIAGEIMSFIQDISRDESSKIAEGRGSFPNIEGSVHDEPMRNATTTTIAPTGSISIIGGCSSGIEPLFAINYKRNVLDDTLIETHPIFENLARERGFYSEELMERVAGQNSIQDMEEIPADIREIFVTAHDVDPEWHIKMQAAFQKYVDNAVSKTVNFRNQATVADVKKVYTMAHKLKCKGVTIYRDGSRSEQVLSTDKNNIEHSPEQGKRDRPPITIGTTEKHKIGCGKLYITINADNKGICEVFTTTGKGGGCHAQSEAISRLASLTLRSGVPPAEVIGQLRGIRCEAAMMRKDVHNVSCPDAIGRALETFIENTEEGKLDLSLLHHKDTYENLSTTGEDRTTNTGSTYNNRSVCPECGFELEHEGGCAVCRNCGWSKCG